MVDCPICGQSTIKSSTRLVQDSCGHTKCRLCLLKEENGCEICYEDIQKLPIIINTAENHKKQKTFSPQNNTISTSLHCQSPNSIIKIIQDKSIYDNHAIFYDVTDQINFIITDENNVNNYVELCKNETSIGNCTIIGDISIDTSQVTSSNDQVSSSLKTSQSKKSFFVNNDGKSNSKDTVQENVKDVSNNKEQKEQQTSSQQVNNTDETNSISTEPIQNKNIQEQSDSTEENQSINGVNTVDNSVDTFKKPCSPKIKNFIANRNEVSTVMSEDSQSNKTLDHVTNLKSPEYNLTDYLIFKKPNEKGGYTYSIESPNTPSSYRSPEFKLTDYLIFKSPNDRGGFSYSIGSPRISNHKSPDPSMLVFNDLCVGRVEEIQFDSNCDRIEMSPAIDIRLLLEQDSEREREAKVQKNRNYVYNESRSKLLQLVDAIDKIEGMNQLNNIMNENNSIDERNQEIDKRIEEVENTDVENKENKGECKKSEFITVQDKSKLKSMEKVAVIKITKLCGFPKKCSDNSNDSEMIDEEKLKKLKLVCNKLKKRDNAELEKDEKKKKEKAIHKKKVQKIKKPITTKILKTSPTRLKATCKTKIDWSHIIPLPDDPSTYKCSLCNKILKNFRCRAYHRQCLTGAAAYKCGICNKTFVKKSHYEYHERMHTGDRPFKCEECKKSFAQKNKLNRHMMTHAKELNFLCDHCGKSCATKDYLRRHINVHSTNSLKCRFCPKMFKSTINLKCHELTHSTEKPFKCSQCPKKFKLKMLLTRHEKRHKQLRPYSCSHCNRFFSDKAEVHRHMPTHFAHLFFTCQFCDTEFKRKDNLKRHVKSHHPEVVSKSNVIATQQQRQDKLQTYNQEAETNNIVKNQENNENLCKRTRNSKCTDDDHVGHEETGKEVESNNKVRPRKARKSISGKSMPLLSKIQINFIDPINAVPVINGRISTEKTERARMCFTKPIPLENARLINQKIEESTYCSFPGLARKVDMVVGRRDSISSNSNDTIDLTNKQNQKRAKTGKMVKNKQNDQQQKNNDLNPTKKYNYVHWRRRTAETLKSKMLEN